jgi:hypothetical protein
MENPETLATLGKKETRRRQNKIYGTTQYVLETTLMQTKTNKVNKTRVHLQTTMTKISKQI